MATPATPQDTLIGHFAPSPESTWLFQLAGMIVMLPLFCLYLTSRRFENKPEKVVAKQAAEISCEVPSKVAVDASKVTPLPDFNWTIEEPLQLRPFKPKYHLTMALENTIADEIVEMDNTYLDRLAIRRQVIAEHSKTVLAANDRVKPAADELYTWMTSYYLPTKYPTVFTKSSPDTLHNLITNEFIPTVPSASPSTSLTNIGSQIDVDFLILLPSPDGDGYTLDGFLTCFPNGFDSASKMNLKLRDIHGPVPHYKAKLEKSMDRFFARIEAGTFVKRANWTITTNPELFAAFGGNHLYEGEEAEVEVIHPDKSWMRCEKQMLWRLPQTQALVFSFKTYMYPLRQIKEEGLGEQLAEAIEGMAGGSAPGIYEYKRGVAWGESAKEYLRS